jgi:type I restriction enzyme S subunit
MAPLEQIAEVRLGRQRSPKNHSGNQMRPYLRAANVDWDGLKLRDVKSMNFTDSEADTYRLQPGDLLLSEASGSSKEVGKPALWRGEIADCCFQNTLLRVRASGPDPRFLLHFFRHEALRGAFAEKSRGVGIHHLGASRLSSWPIPLPPFAEQQRIVNALEDYLSRLDTALSVLDAVARRRSALEKLLITAVVSGCETVSTGSWPQLTLSQLTVSAGYGTSTKCSHEGLGRPVVRIPNVIEGQIDLSDLKYAVDPAVELASYRLGEGDLLVVRTNGSPELIGRTAVVGAAVEAAFASYLIRFRLRHDLVTPHWVSTVLTAPGWRSRLEALAASSAGQYNLNIRTLGSLPIPVPPLDEQESLLTRVRNQRSGLERLSEQVRTLQERGKALRRALLSAAFSGRLVPHDPDDEPAELLLKRIRAERDALPRTHRSRSTRRHGE